MKSHLSRKEAIDKGSPLEWFEGNELADGKAQHGEGRAEPAAAKECVGHMKGNMATLHSAAGYLARSVPSRIGAIPGVPKGVRVKPGRHTHQLVSRPQHLFIWLYYIASRCCTFCGFRIAGSLLRTGVTDIVVIL